jgi:hypothetical protein
MFRTGHPTPRYPATITVELRRRLRLLEHHPHWPEPQIGWIPQTIWPLAVSAALLPCTRPELRGSMLSMVLAKLGSTARWTSICDDLALPANHANRIGGLLRYIPGTGHWPHVLDSLEQLMTLLQQHPPSIDYQAHRAHADQVDAFVTASPPHAASTPARGRPACWSGSCGNASPAATSPTHPTPCASTPPAPPTPRSAASWPSETPTSSTSSTGSCSGPCSRQGQPRGHRPPLSSPSGLT